MQSDLKFSINGNPHRGGGTPVQWGLLDYLRENRITSAKDACESGACGACSVLLVDSDCRQRPVFRVVNACQLSLPMVAGREIWTAEAFSGREHGHPLQNALSQCEQFSCGYCLPGFSMAFAENHVLFTPFFDPYALFPNPETAGRIFDPRASHRKRS